MSFAVIARFPLREPSPPRQGRMLAVVAVSALAIALAVFLHLGAGAVALPTLILVGLGWRVYRERARVRGWICFYPWGVTREDDQGSVRLLGFGEPFGVSLLADHSRSHALLAFTTPTHTRYASVHAMQAPPALLARATTIAESDAAVLTAPFAMSGVDVLALLRLIEQVSPRATERLFLNGSRGERIALDLAELRVEPLRDTGFRARTFDLRSPLEWRGFMFHESIGPVTTLYQATWVRQGTGEIVFVAPMPHVLATDRRVGLSGEDFAQVVRDLRLMQSLPDSPPPRELRTAIERAFMLPLRQALDRAPRAARSVPPSRLQSSPDHV